MEEKKSVITTSHKSIFVYIQELKEELKKVSWTTREELRFATKAVVLSTLVFGLGIYLEDFIIRGFLNAIKMTVHFIFG